MLATHAGALLIDPVLTEEEKEGMVIMSADENDLKKELTLP